MCNKDNPYFSQINLKKKTCKYVVYSDENLYLSNKTKSFTGKIIPIVNIKV